MLVVCMYIHVLHVCMLVVCMYIHVLHHSVAYLNI